MTTHQNKNNLLVRFIHHILETIKITVDEYRHVLNDVGVMIIVIVAPLIYPPLYCSIYKNETLCDVPIAVVDNSHSSISRYLVRQLDATPDLKVEYRCNTLKEAQNIFNERQVHGIVYIPSDFSDKINHVEQATLSMYSDMSSFLYYRAMMTACNYTVLEMGKNIQIERLSNQGITGESANISAAPLQSASTILYNQSSGFASFLMPAILILILHQTLFFGIGMMAGTTREENRFHLLLPANSKRSISQIVIGKALCYFSLYAVFTFYILGFIPKLFNLPHIGNFNDIIIFIVPFLLATIFFSMTISIFVRNRETGMVTFLFCSLILLFLSGFSWPRSNMNGFWLAFSWLFPSTPGIQAYIKVNTMGADLLHIEKEYIVLWIQTGVYFLTTIVVYRLQIKGSYKRAMKTERQM